MLNPFFFQKNNNFEYVTGDAQERQMADNLDYVDDILDEMDYLGNTAFGVKKKNMSVNSTPIPWYK